VFRRLAVQAALSVGAVWFLGRWFSFPWWAAVIAATAFVTYVNCVNFMDGINGISGLHGLLIGAAYAVVGSLADMPWLTFTGMLVAAAFAAFLPWNLIPPGGFLGDVGSYALGGALAVTALGAVFAGAPWLALAAPVSIYLADVMVTLVWRSARREPLFAAHRMYAYQRLAQRFGSHIGATATVGLFTLAASAMGLLTATGRVSAGVGAALVAGLMALYVALPRAVGCRMPPATPVPLTAAGALDPLPPRAEFRPVVWAVVGAGGFVGRAVRSLLEQHGHQVVAVPAPRLELTPRAHDGAAVSRLAATLEARQSLAEAFAGADVVVNAAGLAAPDSAANPELYGANSLLPAVVAWAAADAAVTRVVHISTVAVQGPRRTIDATMNLRPFSPYSRSKALGELSLLAGFTAARPGCGRPDVVIVRATRVQGEGRAETERLARLARSPLLAAVARPGTQPTAVSSVSGLAGFIYAAGATREPIPPVLLQPWEGLSVSDVLFLAGGRRPRLLPAGICRAVVGVGKLAGRVAAELAGPVRRVELAWFGQGQDPAATVLEPPASSTGIVEVLRRSRAC
jgi:dTDP-4-dehydrorhamnose reductase